METIDRETTWTSDRTLEDRSNIAQDQCRCCGVSLGHGANFCSNCGTPVSTSHGDGPPRHMNCELQAENQHKRHNNPATSLQTPRRQFGNGHPQREDYFAQHQTDVREYGTQLVPESDYYHGYGRSLQKTSHQYRLVCRSRNNPEQRAEVDVPELIIGKSDDSDLVICGDEFISRKHARIVRQGNSFLLEDLGSSNGTFVKVATPVQLHSGDEILIGSHLLRFENAS